MNKRRIEIITFSILFIILTILVKLNMLVKIDNYIYNPTKYTIKKEEYTNNELPEEPNEIEELTTKTHKKQDKK